MVIAFNLRWFQQQKALVMRGHSRSKNGVALFAYDPRIHADASISKP
jgi:hypothetical protein